jgi:HlyD family secretion protein
VKEGQEVEFTVDAYSGTTFTGKVRQVRISPATSDNVVTTRSSSPWPIRI